MEGLVKHSRAKEEAGLALIEVLVAALLISIISLAVTYNLARALQTAKLTEVNHAASSLAISKMELLSAVDTPNLNSSYDSTETDLSWPNLEISFTRTVTVVVNADESRTITVVVESNSDKVPTSVQFATTFAVWE